MLGAEVEAGVQRFRFITASALLLPAVVLAFMTVRPVWTPQIAAPAAKYQVPALLAGLWFVMVFPLALVLGV
ncbi:hypothetical protein GCM10023081_01570 [Arthrobacter ginkgonis]|uniref:Uncharacterized protein n=1 Tax=Arthrobacter ginkgonis TaxID=1630594 RepID=A0ABP7BQV3_9MICC